MEIKFKKYLENSTVTAIFLTAIITFAVTAYSYNRMHKCLDSDEFIKKDILNLIEAHLVCDNKIETLRSLKKDQINNLVVNKNYCNASNKDVYNVSKLVVSYYDKIEEKIPKDAKYWVFASKESKSK